MNTYLDSQGIKRPDRRSNTRLRSIYDEARGHIDRFYHNGHEWAGSSMDYLALRVVHEHFPELTPQEIRSLVGAIERSYQAAGA